MPASERFVEGYNAAMKRSLEQEVPDFTNPYRDDTDEYRGFEEAVYDLTQK